MKFSEQHEITGHLRIYKVGSSGKEELVFDDHNIIVSGMSMGIAQLFTLSGSQSILDYQIDRFQIGVSGYDGIESVSLSELSGALSSFDEYGGAESNLFLETGAQFIQDVQETGKTFALIPFSQVTRIGDTTVRYTIVLDKDACNDIDRGGGETAINEIGLFLKNPFGLQDSLSVMAAYRKFSNIVKTNEFALVFRWDIAF